MNYYTVTLYREMPREGELPRVLTDPVIVRERDSYEAAKEALAKYFMTTNREAHVNIGGQGIPRPKGYNGMFFRSRNPTVYIGVEG